MNQASDMLVIQSLAFFGKKLLFLEKNKKICIAKTKTQDKVKNSNIVKKISFAPGQSSQLEGRLGGGLLL
jgi:hypothetical protein